jgi:hypothetical protein
MSCANIIARMPEPHILLSVTAPVESGSPALRVAWRAGAFDRGLDRDGAQLPGGEVGEVAQQAADRRTGGRDDDDGIGHGKLLQVTTMRLGVPRSSCATRLM